MRLNGVVAIFIGMILGVMLYFLGPIVGAIIGFGIIAGILFRILYLLNAIHKRLSMVTDEPIRQTKVERAMEEYLKDKNRKQG